MDFRYFKITAVFEWKIMDYVFFVQEMWVRLLCRALPYRRP